MNIAIFSDNFYPALSGISDSILIAGKALARKGHTVDFFVPTYSRADYESARVPFGEPPLEANNHVYRVFSLGYPAKDMQWRFVIPNWFRKPDKKYDVVHSNSFWGAGIDALWFARRQNIPLVVTNHTHIESYVQHGPIDTAWSRKLAIDYMIWYHDKASIVTSPAPFLCEDMKKKGLKKDPIVVSNPIEDEFFAPADKDELKKKFGFSPFTFLYGGRISPEKSIDVLLDSFIASAKEMPEACLVIAGGGPTKKELEERAKKSAASDRIFFLGPYVGAERKNFVDIFHAADVFAISSISEIQSMVTLQAMASGLPVVSADASGQTVLVGKDRGILFAPGNREALSNALIEMYTNSEARMQMGQHAHEFALSRRSDAIAAEWEKVYSKAIEIYEN